MTVEEFCTVDELQVLFNLLSDNIRVSFPLYNLHMIDAKANGHTFNLKVKITRQDFDDERFSFGDYASEMPSYSDFIQVLLASGVISFKNMDAFCERFENIRKWPQSKRIVFSADTNMFYNRFFSNFREISPKEIILVDGVKEEIKAAQNSKYNASDITEMKKHVRYNKHIFDEFANRKKKKTRKAAYLAQREYNSVVDGVLRIIPGIEKLSYDKENNDKILVSTLSISEERRHNIICFLTADDNVSELCKIERIEYFLFEIPNSVDADSCTCQQFRELVFNMARVFGVVQVGSVIIYGEYKEKSSNRPDHVMLEFQNEDLFVEFKKDIVICRRLNEVGI